MGGGMGGFGAGAGMGNQAQPQAQAQPEIVYREQLSQLNAMGFSDAQQNIAALVATGGNVEAAVSRLVGG